MSPLRETAFLATITCLALLGCDSPTAKTAYRPGEYYELFGSSACVTCKTRDEVELLRPGEQVAIIFMEGAGLRSSDLDRFANDSKLLAVSVSGSSVSLESLKSLVKLASVKCVELQWEHMVQSEEVLAPLASNDGIEEVWLPMMTITGKCFEYLAEIPSLRFVVVGKGKVYDQDKQDDFCRKRRDVFVNAQN